MHILLNRLLLQKCKSLRHDIEVIRRGIYFSNAVFEKFKQTVIW